MREGGAAFPRTRSPPLRFRARRGAPSARAARVLPSPSGVRGRCGTRLLAAELGRTLLHVGVQAFARILAREELLLQLALDRKRLAERYLESRLDRALDPPHRLRGFAGWDELPCVLENLRVE